VGLLAAAAFVTSIKAFLTSHLARPEGWLGAMVLLAVFAVWRAVERKRTVAAAVLAGIASVAPVDIHPQGIVFVLGLGLAFVWAAGARRRRWDLIGGYVAGGVIGGLAFVAAHAWPSPQLAWQQLVQFAPHYTSLGDSEPGPNALDNLQSLAPFFQLIYWTAGGPLGLLEAGLGAAGVISASLRRTVGDEILVITGVVSMMVFGLVFSQRLVQYGVLWSPFLFLLGAAALERTAEWIATRFRLAAARNSVSPMKWVSDAAVLLGLAGAGIAGLNLAGDVWLVRQYQGGNFAEMNAALARLAPAGASVMGDPNWWWELHKGREYIADDYLVWPGLVSEPDSGAHVPGVMARLRPDYILLDTALGCRIDADPAWAALHEYATEHCELAGQVDGPWLGDEGKRTSLLAQTTSVYQCRL